MAALMRFLPNIWFHRGIGTPDADDILPSHLGNLGYHGDEIKKSMTRIDLTPLDEDENDEKSWLEEITSRLGWWKILDDLDDEKSWMMKNPWLE